MKLKIIWIKCKVLYKSFEKKNNLDLFTTSFSFFSSLGLWDVIPMELPGNGRNTAGFSQVFVSGDKMTFSGGPYGRTQVQTISIHRTPEGTIYIDDKGSVLTNFDPQNGVIEVKNVLGFKIMWKRSGDFAITSGFGRGGTRVPPKMELF